MATNLPRMTILMPSLNAARFVVEAVESVRRQNYPDLEYLVLDGGSSDGTQDVLLRYSELSLISEADHSAHEALNKGIARASGEIIGALGADDFYADHLLRDVGRLFAADESIDVVVGNSGVFEDDESGRHILAEYRHLRDGGLWLPELTFGIPGLFGCFFRRRVFNTESPFRVDYRFAADRHLLISLKLIGVKSVSLDQPAIWYRRHRGSATISPDMLNVMPISREYFRMAAEFAEQTQDRLEAHRIFRAWGAVEGAKLLIRHAHTGEFAEAAATFRTLARSNRSLPLDLARGLRFRAMIRSLNRADRPRAGAALRRGGRRP
jgi:glycosyltransferase involved in cell wall biosynthesis